MFKSFYLENPFGFQVEFLNLKKDQLQLKIPLDNSDIQWSHCGCFKMGINLKL